MDDFCWLCVRNRTRRWLRHERKAYVRWLRDKPSAVWINAVLVTAGILAVTAVIATVVLGPAGWR